LIRGALVEDDDDDMFFLKRLLKKAGLLNKVVTFQDPRTAIGYLDAECRVGNRLMLPCIVFTDFVMTGVNGLQFVEWCEVDRSSQARLSRLCRTSLLWVRGTDSFWREALNRCSRKFLGTKRCVRSWNEPVARCSLSRPSPNTPRLKRDRRAGWHRGAGLLFG
jgi:hypothetical protein